MDQMCHQWPPDQLVDSRESILGNYIGCVRVVSLAITNNERLGHSIPGTLADSIIQFVSVACPFLKVVSL